MLFYLYVVPCGTNGWFPEETEKKVSENLPKNGSTSELFVVVLTGKSSDVCLCIFTMSTHLAKIRALPILQAVHFATGSSGSFLHVLLIAVSESLQPISPANQSGWISEEWGDAPHRTARCAWVRRGQSSNVFSYNLVPEVKCTCSWHGIFYVSTSQSKCRCYSAWQRQCNSLGRRGCLGKKR